MNYLLPMDGSEYAGSAASFLSRFPLAKGDHVDIVHVITEPGGFGETYALYDEIYRIKTEFGEKILEEAAQKFEGAEPQVRMHLARGYPYREILEEAKKKETDLIVMGSRGLAGFESFLLGSVTRKVAINAPVPVLVIKPAQAEPRDRPLNILFATDGSECANRAAATLHSLPLPSSARLTILNVVDSPLGDIPERFGVEVDERIKATVAEVRGDEITVAEKLLAGEKNKFKDRFEYVETVVKSGEVAPTIIEKVKKIEADIVALGCRGEKGLKGMLGGVSRRVLSYAPCSVLVAKIPE